MSIELEKKTYKFPTIKTGDGEYTFTATVAADQTEVDAKTKLIAQLEDVVKQLKAMK